jgi:hypothetical protein
MVRRTSGIRELIIFFLQIFDVIFYLHFNYSISFLLAFSGLFRNSNDNNVYNNNLTHKTHASKNKDSGSHPRKTSIKITT